MFEKKSHKYFVEIKNFKIESILKSHISSPKISSKSILLVFVVKNLQFFVLKHIYDLLSVPEFDIDLKNFLIIQEKFNIIQSMQMRR